MDRHKTPSDKRWLAHRGIAAAEFAVCLPLIMVLLLGTLEVSTTIFLKQTLSIAAYEGARTAITSNATASDVEEACNRILIQRNVAGSVIAVSPSPLASQAVQSWITVTVSAPASSNSVIQELFYSSHIVSAHATMMKEY
jgi:Flp pilus assembly protein TadG